MKLVTKTTGEKGRTQATENGGVCGVRRKICWHSRKRIVHNAGGSTEGKVKGRSERGDSLFLIVNTVNWDGSILGSDGFHRL